MKHMRFHYLIDHGEIHLILIMLAVNTLAAMMTLMAGLAVQA